VWFVGQRADYVASLNPATGAFNRYDLPDGAGPHNLIVDDDGMVWYAGNRQAHIGKLDPETGQITKYPMPDPAARDPHTLIFDNSGHIWFTVQGGNFIGRLEKTSGQVDLVPSPVDGSRPYGIILDPSEQPWIALFGTNKLATVDPATLELEVVDLPRSEARPRRLQSTSNGKIWYVDYAGGMLGRYDPVDRSFSEWKMPAGNDAKPYGMAVDKRDRLWFVETGPQPNNFVGFDPDSERFIRSTPVPSGGRTIRHMYYDEQLDAVWFGTDSNTVGRASVDAKTDV
jgi:virginiamycin B lyase